MKRIALTALAVSSVTACSQETTTPRGPGFEISVAPLALPGVVDACYRLTVYNTGAAGIGPGAIVWQEGSLCADQYGDGRGSITYVGTCDASPSGRTNTVSLELEGLCQTTGCDPANDSDPGTIASTTYVNPCPVGAPCLIEHPCTENADTEVDFDLTIMRRANQGFFDVAVTFTDVFCSAKLDCVPELLHRPGGARDLTAVLAFACTSGANDTCLYATSVELDCGGNNVWQINPALGPGNISESSPLLYGAATYQGDEAFTSFEKSYWNIALGLDESMFSTYPNCTLRWTTTASEGELDGAGPFTTPAGTTYPLLTWERDIVVGGQLDCASHGLDEVLQGEEVASVATAYSAPAGAMPFAYTNCEPDTATCTCPEGYTANGDGTICRRELSVPATASSTTLDVCAGDTDTGYSANGARFTTSWLPGTFEIPESGNPAGTCTDPATCVSETTGWSGYLGEVGVWACPPGVSTNTWIGFSQCVTLPSAGDYLIGIAGDNEVRLSVDGDLVYESVSSLNFRAWNVGRLTLAAGTHIIEMSGLDHGTKAAFGAEIYGPFAPGTVATPALMAAALDPPIGPGLIVFSTRDLRPDNGTPVAQFQTSSNGTSGFTCNDGFALNLCGATPTCTDIDEIACGSTGGGGGTAAACDAPGTSDFVDAFVRPDGPLGSSYVDLSGLSLPLGAPMIVSEAACSAPMAVAVVQANPPAVNHLLHVEFDVTFGHDQGRQAMAVALDTCPAGGPTVVTAGLDGGNDSPLLTISAPFGGGPKKQAPTGIPLLLNHTYRLYADFEGDGDVLVVLRDGLTTLGELSANVLTDLGMPAVPSYHQAGFVIGRQAGVAPSCVDNFQVQGL